MVNYLFATPNLIGRTPAMQAVKSPPMRNLDRLTALGAERVAAQDAVDRLTKQIEKEIVAARADNWPWPQIMDAAQLSRQGAIESAKRGNKGVMPVPRQRQ